MNRRAPPSNLIPRAAACVAAAITLIALWRRWQEAAMAASFAPRAVMVPATAVGTLLAAGVLLLVQHMRRAIVRSYRYFAAAAIVTLGAVVVGQAASGKVWLRVLDGEAWWTQRPSPPTGLGFVFIGVSLLLFGHERFRVFAHLGAAATLTVAFTALTGHAYGASALYGLNEWGGMSLSTLTAFSLLALGVLFVDPPRGIAAVSVSKSAGGNLLRRLAPAALLAPLLLGWLVLTAEQAGVFDAAFATALLSVSVTVLLVALIVRHALALHYGDKQREELLAREQEARAEAERRREELERVTESRAGLIRGFSHDVRNPLAIADLYAEILERGARSTKEQEHIQRIRRSIRTSARLIDDLLEIARAEAGQLEIECVHTDVGQIAREVAEDFRAPAAAVGLGLDVRAPDGLEADTDPMRLRQILANLLSNTVKYAPDGRVTIDAAIRHSGGPGPAFG